MTTEPDISVLMAAARHNSPTMVLTYRKDADAKWRKVVDEKDTTNMVGPWSPIHFDNPQDMERIGSSARYTKDLDELAKDFVEITLGIPAGCPQSKNIPYIIEKALAWSPNKTADEELSELLSEKMGLEDKKMVLDLVARMIESEKASARNDERQASATLGTATSTGLPRDNQLKDGGRISLSTEKVKINSLSWSDKYKTWKATIEEFENGKYQPKNITGASNSLLKRSRKMVKCIDNCFGGNIDEFEKHWTENGKMKANTSNYKCSKVPCKCGQSKA